MNKGAALGLMSIEADRDSERESFFFTVDEDAATPFDFVKVNRGVMYT